MGIKFLKRAGNLAYHGDVNCTAEEKDILRQCGLAVQSYLDAQLPKNWRVPVKGIEEYCYHNGWIIRRNPCTGKWQVAGKRQDIEGGL